MAVVRQPKVKERRRGKKEIHRDNQEYLKFYLLFSLGGTVSYPTYIPAWEYATLFILCPLQALQILHLLYFHFVAQTTSWWDVVSSLYHSLFIDLQYILYISRCSWCLVPVYMQYVTGCWSDWLSPTWAPVGSYLKLELTSPTIT